VDKLCANNLCVVELKVFAITDRVKHKLFDLSHDVDTMKPHAV